MYFTTLEITQNKREPWHVAIEEANQTGILATGGDIGILSQACTWDSQTSFPLYRDPTRTKHIYHRAGLLFAFTIMRPCFLGVQDV